MEIDLISHNQAHILAMLVRTVAFNEMILCKFYFALLTADRCRNRLAFLGLRIRHLSAQRDGQLEKKTCSFYTPSNSYRDLQ